MMELPTTNRRRKLLVFHPIFCLLSMLLLSLLLITWSHPCAAQVEGAKQMTTKWKFPEGRIVMAGTEFADVGLEFPDLKPQGQLGSAVLELTKCSVEVIEANSNDVVDIVINNYTDSDYIFASDKEGPNWSWTWHVPLLLSKGEYYFRVTGSLGATTSGSTVGGLSGGPIRFSTSSPKVKILPTGKVCATGEAHRPVNLNNFKSLSITEPKAGDELLISSSVHCSFSFSKDPEFNRASVVGITMELMRTTSSGKLFHVLASANVKPSDSFYYMSWPSDAYAGFYTVRVNYTLSGVPQVQSVLSGVFVGITGTRRCLKGEQPGTESLINNTTSSSASRQLREL